LLDRFLVHIGHVAEGCRVVSECRESARRRGRRIQGPPTERDSRVDEETAEGAINKQQ
jgi:hypothetical protein